MNLLTLLKIIKRMSHRLKGFKRSVLSMTNYYFEMQSWLWSFILIYVFHCDFYFFICQHQFRNTGDERECSSQGGS